MSLLGQNLWPIDHQYDVILIRICSKLHRFIGHKREDFKINVSPFIFVRCASYNFYEKDSCVLTVLLIFE